MNDKIYILLAKYYGEMLQDTGHSASDVVAVYKDIEQARTHLENIVMWDTKDNWIVGNSDRTKDYVALYYEKEFNFCNYYELEIVEWVVE